MWQRRFLVLFGAFAFILSRVARYTHSYSINNRSNNPQKSLAANFYELLMPFILKKKVIISSFNLIYDAFYVIFAIFAADIMQLVKYHDKNQRSY